MYICDMELAAHIHYLLYRHDCVTIPGFGAFLVSYKEAYFDEARQLYFPPSKKLSFNEQIQSNDGILASHLARTLGISYERAVLEGHQQIIAWKGKVQKAKLTLPSLGTFELNREGKLVFSPDKGLNFLAASYALPMVAAQVVSRGITQKTAQPPVYFTLEKTKSKRIIGYAAVAASVLALFAVSSNSYNNQQADNQWLAEQALRQEARELAGVSVYDLGELPTLKIELPTEQSSQQPYHIIAGSFRSQVNAKRLANSLQQQGYSSAQYLSQTPSGFYQVSFASYASMREAYNAMGRIKRNNYPDAWVLKK